MHSVTLTVRGRVSPQLYGGRCGGLDTVDRCCIGTASWARGRSCRGRDDVAVLWDIRVSPRERGRGIGSALFRAAGDWARARGCRWFKIETQNVNVPRYIGRLQRRFRATSAA
jgi:GNAT superfamily N-acetyltransferase